MTSTALVTWQTDRAARIARLEAAHTAVGGTGPGRRWLTDELNQSLVLRLAAEFQGFARDLHNEATVAMASALAPTRLQLQASLATPYMSARRMNRGNADLGNLGYDFGLFSMKLWQEIDQRYPSRGLQWRQKLGTLNEARNGVAHDDAQRIAAVAAQGWPITLASVRNWRSALDGLTTGMDDVVGRHLQVLLGTRPW